MKGFISLAMALSSTLVFAKTSSGTADWVVEIGTMVIERGAATDLYLRLDAIEVVDPNSTNYDQYRTKENKFVKCGLSFYGGDSQDGDTNWVVQDKNWPPSLWAACWHESCAVLTKGPEARF